MSQILQLEYACTDAEQREAQELHLRRQIGGGSKWRTLLILYAALIGAFYVLYQRVIRDLPAAFQPYAIAGFCVFVVVLLFWKRKSRSREPQTNWLEVSEMEVTIVGPGSRFAVPWAAFSECVESPNLFVLVDRPKQLLLIVPKRVFPSESSQNWFGALARNRPEPAQPTSTPLPSPSPSSDRLTVTFQLGFRDYLDRTLASWRTRGIFLLTAIMMFGSWAYSAMNPPPRAVYSSLQVLVLFMLPFMLVMAVMVVLVVSIYTWRAHAKYLIQQEVVLSDESVGLASADGSGVLPWTTYTRFKETRRSFIVWNPRNSLWLLLPKRTFAFADDIGRCHALLSRHLQHSRWFFG